MKASFLRATISRDEVVDFVRSLEPFNVRHYAYEKHDRITLMIAPVGRSSEEIILEFMNEGKGMYKIDTFLRVRSQSLGNVLDSFVAKHGYLARLAKDKGITVTEADILKAFQSTYAEERIAKLESNLDAELAALPMLDGDAKLACLEKLEAIRKELFVLER